MKVFTHTSLKLRRALTLAITLAGCASPAFAALELVLSDSFNGAVLEGASSPIALNTRINETQSGLAALSPWIFGYDNAGGRWQSVGLDNVDGGTGVLRVQAFKNTADGYGWVASPDLQSYATSLGNDFIVEFRAEQTESANGDIIFAMGDKSFTPGVWTNYWSPNNILADGLLQIRYVYTGRILVDTGNDTGWDVNQTSANPFYTYDDFAVFRIVGTDNGDGTTEVEVYMNGTLAVPAVTWGRTLDSAPLKIALATRGGSGSSASVNNFDRFKIEIGVPDPFNPAPQITDFSIMPDGSASLEWAGENYQVFKVERSIDLSEWETVASGISPSILNELIDQDADSMDQAFYRVDVDWLVSGNPAQTVIDGNGNVALSVSGDSTPASGQFTEVEASVPNIPAGTELHLVIAALGDAGAAGQILVDAVSAVSPGGSTYGPYSFESGLSGWLDNFDVSDNRNGGVLTDMSSYDAVTPDGSSVAWLDQRGGGAAISRYLGTSVQEGAWTIRAAIGARNDVPMADGYALILMADTSGDGNPDAELGRFAGDTFSAALTRPDSLDLDTFKIDLWIDPVENAIGHDSVRAGITMGLTSPQDSPIPDLVDGLISWTLSETQSLEKLGPHLWVEKRGYWEIWVDGVNRSKLPNPVEGDLDNGTSQLPYCFRPHDGPYHIRIVAVPQGNGSLLRFYFEDMLRPVEEHFVDRVVTPEIVAFFTDRESGRSETAQFSGYSVEAITEAEALATYDSSDYVMNLLDLDYPGLEAVKAAWLAGNTSSAKSLFAQYMRARTSPTAPALDAHPNSREVADNALNGLYGESVWHRGPYVDMSYAVDDPRLHWELDTGYLNRHYHWVSLAKAYQDTGNEAYAARFDFELSDWVDREPFFRENNPFVGLDTMDGTQFRIGWLNTSNIGRRCEQTWWQAFEGLKASPSVSEDAIFKFLDGVIRQSRLIRNPAAFAAWDDGGGHVTAAILQNSAMFPECVEAADWRTLADERVDFINQTQIYDDNSHASLSTGYGFAYFDSLFTFTDILERVGDPVPQNVLDTLERAYEWPMAISRPNRALIELNDGNDIIIPTSYYQRAFSLFPDRSDFEWFATSGTQGTPPDYESTYLPNAGWVTMRTGWGSDETWLFMDAGPFGASHGKNDKLSVWLARGSKLLLQSGGRAPYGSAWTQYSAYTDSSRSQNVIHLNDMLQSRIQNDNEIYAYDPEPRRWHTDESFDYAEGFYDLGNNTFGYAGAWSRQIVHVKGDNPPSTSYYVVFDTIDSDNRDIDLNFRALFHSRCENAEIAATGDPVVDLWDAAGSCRIIPVATNEGLTASLIRGQTDPYVQGWHLTYGGNLNEAWCLAYDWNTTVQTIKAWVLVPAAGDRSWTTLSADNVSVDSATGTISAELQRADGGTDFILRRPEGSAPTTLGGVAVNGDVVVVSKDSSGTVERVFESEVKPKLVIEEDTTTETAYPAETTDLANQDRASFGGISNSNYTPGGTASGLFRLFDGAVGSAGVLADGCLSDGDEPYSFDLDFDLSTNTDGYDITEIRTIAGWLSQRARQHVVIEYRMVGESEFRFLCRGRQGYFVNGQPHSTRLTWSHPETVGVPIATNVAALRFKMKDHGKTSGAGVVMREIDVIGRPTATLELVLSDSFDGAVLEGTNTVALNTRINETQSGLAAPTAWTFGYDNAGGKWQSAGLDDVDAGTGVLRVQAFKNTADGYGWAASPDLQSHASSLGNSFIIEFKAEQAGSPNGDIIFAMGDKSFTPGVWTNYWSPNNLLADDLLQFRYLYDGRMLVDTGNDTAWDLNQASANPVYTFGNFADFRVVGTDNGDGTTKIEIYVNDVLAVPSVTWGRTLDSAPFNIALATRGGSSADASFNYFDSFKIEIWANP